MNACGAPVSGRSVLRGYLSAQEPDPRTLSVQAFGLWLQGTIERQLQSDPLFAARWALRELLREHRAELVPWLEAQSRSARDLADSETGVRLRQIEREVLGVEQALKGLEQAITHAEGERAHALTEKWETFRDRLRALVAERTRRRATQTSRAATRAAQALRAAEDRLGITAARSEVERAAAERGQGAQRAGREFERAAPRIAEGHVIPELTKDPSDIHVLSNVRLGAARTEFDLAVVRTRPLRTVDVLAVVEAKRDPSDLGHGFLQRQENLAFFTGDASRYDVSAYRTEVYRTGRFDRTVAHTQDGRTFRFDLSSFGRFRRNRAHGWFLDRLFFVTTERPLRGMSAALYGRLMHRVAADPDLDPTDPAQLAALQRWVIERSEPLSAADVLEMYATSPRLGRRIVWL